MHRLLMGAAALSLAACTTLDDVRREPFQWFAYYSVPFDTMANCLAARSAQYWGATPQINSEKGRAYVTLADKGGSQIVAEYAIWREGDEVSLVGWRRRRVVADLIGLQAGSSEAADRCGGPRIRTTTAPI